MVSEAGVGTKFFIESRDFEGNHRVNGGDEFKVFFIEEHEAQDVKDKGNFAIVKDLEDGSYQVICSSVSHCPTFLTRLRF